MWQGHPHVKFDQFWNKEEDIFHALNMLNAVCFHTKLR